MKNEKRRARHTGVEIERQCGVIAILDALGAKNYTDDEVRLFLSSRERVLDLLDQQAEGLGTLEPDELTTFTFNDTIVVVLKAGTQRPTLKKVATFAAVLRQFLVNSLAHGLLFRGAAAIGTFYLNDERNTVMGDAVTDAAQWYEHSDWIGVHFTPRSFIELEGLLHVSDDKKSWAFIRYEVPLREKGSLSTFAINWPKVFLVARLRPWNDTTAPRVKLLEFLAANRVPRGVERKYYNTLEFFDHSLRIEAAKKR